MAERKKREKVPNMESLTMGNCTISLTLDTRYRDDNGKYHASIRFTVNGSRYFFHLGNKYTVEEFDAISKADGRGRGGNQSQNFIDRNRLGMKVLHLMPTRLLDCGMKLYRRRKPVRQRPIVMRETVSSRAKSMMLRMAIM